MAAEPPEKGQNLYAWPLGANLVLLLLLVGLHGTLLHSLGFTMVLLAVVNALIGFIFLLFERRRDSGFAGGFFLSFLLLLLIGFSRCSKEAEPIEVEGLTVPASSSRNVHPRVNKPIFSRLVCNTLPGMPAAAAPRKNSAL